MQKIKEKIINFIFVFSWVAYFWYSFTMKMTKVEIAEDIKPPRESSLDTHIEILKKLKYRSDKLNGLLDIANHPSKTSLNISRDEEAGDCEDFACWNIAALLRANLVDKTYLAFYWMVNAENKLSGHAVTLFEKYGKKYWLDYGNPKEYEDEFEWAKQSAQRYNAVPIAASYAYAYGLKSDLSFSLKNIKVKRDFK